MALVDYEDLGSYDHFRTLIHDLDLEDKFENEFHEPLDEYSLEISEVEVIRRVLEKSPDDYLLITNERTPAYQLLHLPSRQ